MNISIENKTKIKFISWALLKYCSYIQVDLILKKSKEKKEKKTNIVLFLRDNFNLWINLYHYAKISEDFLYRR